MSDHNILDNFKFEEDGFFPEEGESEVVGKYYSAMEAEVAAARLRSEGIPCFLANTNSQSVLTSVMVMVRLHVRPEDVDQARMLLLTEMPLEEQNAAPGSVLKGFFIVLAFLFGIYAIRIAFKLLWGI
jgi:hypothetical protein